MPKTIQRNDKNENISNVSVQCERKKNDKSHLSANSLAEMFEFSLRVALKARMWRDNNKIRNRLIDYQIPGLHQNLPMLCRMSNLPVNRMDRWPIRFGIQQFRCDKYRQIEVEIDLWMCQRELKNVSGPNMNKISVILNTSSTDPQK